MKKVIMLSLLATIIVCNSNVNATVPDSLIDADQSEEMSSTRLNLWIPGIFMKIAAEIAEDHADNEDAAAVDLIRKFGSTTICVREGEYYKDKTDKKMTRKLNRMEKREFEPLVSIISGEEHVNISIRENKHGKIKRIVVLVDEKDTSYVFIKMNCRLKIEDIAQVVGHYSGI